MPKMINNPTKISPLEMFCFLIIGSKIAINRVTEDRQIKPTDTLATLIE